MAPDETAADTTPVLPPPPPSAPAPPPSPPASPPPPDPLSYPGGDLVARALVLLVGGAVTAFLIIFLAVQLAGAFGHQELDDPLSFPAGVQRVVIDIDSGSIEIRGGGAAAVTGTRHRNLGIRQPTIDERVDGDTLRITSRCGPVIVHFCGTSYALDVPREVSVDAESSAGRVTVEQVDGDVRARSDSGGVSVDDIGGTAELRASAGRVEGFRLRSATVTAQSSAGSVQLEFVSAPQSVTARSSAGRVHIEVPRDGSVYRVEAASSVDDPTVDVETSGTADRSIAASSSAGSVDITYAGR